MTTRAPWRLSKTLLAGSPEDPEGRLRLAVNLARMDRAADAEGILRELIEPGQPVPDWVQSVAVQELGRILIDRDEFDEAGVLLGSISETNPGDPTLPILVAYVSDREGRPSLKSDLSEALGQGAVATASSPRLRYSRMPRQALSDMRAELRGESRAQLAALAEALSGDPVVAAAGSR